MRWAPYSIIFVLAISLIMVPSFAQSANTFPVKDPTSGQSYNVNYDITGATVSDMSINSQDTSLVVSLQTTGNGTLTVTLPRTVIDAKTGANDDQFFVLEDGAVVDFQESKTDTDRTLTIPFPDGTEKIEVIGTQVVPEFGMFAYVVLAISVLSVIVFSAKTRFKFGL